MMPQYDPDKHWCVQEYRDGEWRAFMFDTGQREAWAVYQALTNRAELVGIPFRVRRPDGVIDMMNIEAAYLTSDERLRDSLYPVIKEKEDENGKRQHRK